MNKNLDLRFNVKRLNLKLKQSHKFLYNVLRDQIRFQEILYNSK